MNKLMNNSNYRADLKKVRCALGQTDWLEGAAVFITGATGLICSAVIDLLLYCNESGLKNPVKIYAGGRKIERLKQRFGDETGYLKFVEYDTKHAVNFYENVDYIIHGASNSSPELYVSEPVETMLSNVLGAYYLLEFAKKNKTKKLLYISSSEVYGKSKHKEALSETDYSGISVLDVRSSYAISKCAAETLCKSYFCEYGVDATVVRPGHIYGPTALPRDRRVSSLFLYQAAQGKDLVLKSEGTQLRSYCHCLDCASALLTVLLKGECGEAYNISNRNSVITIKQMAGILAAEAGVSLKFDVPDTLEKGAFNPMDNSSLDADKLEALGWRGCFDAETGFRDALRILSALVL